MQKKTQHALIGAALGLLAGPFVSVLGAFLGYYKGNDIDKFVMKHKTQVAMLTLLAFIWFVLPVLTVLFGIPAAIVIMIVVIQVIRMYILKKHKRR